MAITNNDGFNFINAITRKERQGSPLTPDRYNNYLNICFEERLSDAYSQFEKDQRSTDFFESLNKTEALNPDVNGEVLLSALTDTYWHLVGSWYSQSGTFVNIDAVTTDEWNLRRGSTLEQPTIDFPIVIIKDSNLTYYPLADNYEVVIQYLKQPTTPYFDWYYDANDRIQYLEAYVSTPYTLGAGEAYIDKDDGSILGSGESIGSISGGDDADNKTVEMEIPDDEKRAVFYSILSKNGISLEQMNTTQYSMQMESKEIIK